MAVYQVTNKTLLDGYAVLQLLTNTTISVGESITVAGVGTPWNGTFTVYDTPENRYVGVDPNTGELQFDIGEFLPNQVLYPCAGTNVDLSPATGTVTYVQTCTWVTGAEVQAWLGINVSYGTDETAFLAQCASASNQFCWRRRQESGYTGDSHTVAPSEDVKLGTIMYAGALYRQRGSIDQFASFSEMGVAPVTGLSPIVKQLLGLGTHSVA